MKQHNMLVVLEKDQDSSLYTITKKMGKPELGFPVYRGTVDALLQHIDVMSSFQPEYVLMLPGNHKYQIDYADMLAHHQSCRADVSVAVMPVAMEEASRFAVVNIDETDRMLTFDVKPTLPKSNLVSMGIYIFHWELLKKIILVDRKKEDTHYDVEEDMILKMLEEGKCVYAYRFQGE